MAGTINVAPRRHAATRRPASTTPSTASRPAPRRVTGCAPTNTARRARRSRRRSRSRPRASTRSSTARPTRPATPRPPRSSTFGIDIPDPGFPVIQAFADPTSGTAPLLVRFSATGFDPDGGQLSYKWEFANGDFFGRVARAHVHPAGDVHRQGDGDRRRGRQDLAGGHGHGPRPGRRAADGRGLGRRHHAAGAARASPFSAHGHRSGRPGEQPHVLVGLRRRRQLVLPEPDATSTCCRAPTTPRSRSTDGSGATATKTIVITVTDPPGNQNPDFEVGADWNSGTAPLTVQFTVHGGDADGDALAFEWDFDDGSASRDPRAQAHVHAARASTTWCSRSPTARAARRP